MALEISSSHGKQPETAPIINFEGVIREEVPLLVEEIFRGNWNVDQASIGNSIWHILKGLRDSPEMESENVAGFLQHCFANNPVVARDFALLHNKHAASLDLNKPTNTISFSLRSQPPRTRSSTALQKQGEAGESPLRQSFRDDEEFESSTPPNTKKPLQSKSTPVKDIKPQWQEALSKFTKDLFEEGPKEVKRSNDTVPFKIATDPAFLELLPGMLQCFFSLLDSKFGHDEGTSVNHLDTTISMLQQSTNTIEGLQKGNLKLDRIIESANDFANSFSFDTTPKPSSWSNPDVVQRREFCQKAVDFAEASASMAEEFANNEGMHFGAGGARGEKRKLEDDEENESGNEKGPKRRRIVSPPRLRHRRR